MEEGADQTGSCPVPAGCCAEESFAGTMLILLWRAAHCIWVGLSTLWWGLTMSWQWAFQSRKLHITWVTKNQKQHHRKTYTLSLVIWMTCFVSYSTVYFCSYCKTNPCGKCSVCKIHSIHLVFLVTSAQWMRTPIRFLFGPTAKVIKHVHSQFLDIKTSLHVNLSFLLFESVLLNHLNY